MDRDRAFKIAAKSISDIDFTPTLLEGNATDDDYPYTVDVRNEIRDSIDFAFTDNPPLEGLKLASEELPARLDKQLDELKVLWDRSLVELRAHAQDLKTEYSDDPAKLKEKALEIKAEYADLTEEYKKYREMLLDIKKELS